MQSAETDYDIVSYPSYTHAQTHPDRLAVIGTLLGLSPAPVNHCRVLELGCGDATNLAPMAWSLPKSEFTGVDIALRAIESGLEMSRDLGLTNIRLVHSDIGKVDESWGKFDYIVAHGLFSWVPANAREHILKICRQCLAPHGIAFISYGAFPGAHVRRMLSEMMRFHSSGFESPQEQVSQAMALAHFLAASRDENDLYREWLKAELKTVLDHEDGHLYHDELAAINQPFYFTQFIEQAAAHQLQYVAEADYFEMFDFGFSEETREALGQLGRNRILREQYLDFLKCRRFRQTLLCHNNVKLSTDPRVEAIAGFLISSTARCATGRVDLRPGVRQVFQTAKNARCETGSPVGKAALEVMGEIWPVPLAFDKVFEQASTCLEKSGVREGQESGERNGLLQFLANLYAAGVVEFRSTMPDVSQEVTHRPTASPVARWQAQRGRMLTTAYHLSVQVEDELGRNVLLWLDGTLDREQLSEKLWVWLKSKEAIAAIEGNEMSARRKIAEDLERNLAKLARLGLLAG